MTISELYTSVYNGTKSTRYHGMLVYKGESLDTQDEPLLGWIFAKTQQTAFGGKYVVLVDYGDNIITTTLDHSLGRKMIDVGQTTDAGDRVHEMIRRLVSPLHNREQTMWVHADMLEFYKIFKTISKGPLQTLISTTMPVGSLGKAIILGKDTEEDVGHVNNDTGERGTRQEEDVSDSDEGNDNGN